MKSSFARASVLFTGFVVFFILITIRLFYWQVLASDSLQQQAAAQHFTSLTLPAGRGAILDKLGNPMVMNQPAFLVFAEPRIISSVTSFAQKVAPFLALDPAALIGKLSEPNRVWVPMAHQVSTTTVTDLKKLDIAGLGYEKEPIRFYPESSSAAHLLGFVGSDVNGQDVGYFGLEGFYDRQLRGIDGTLRLEKDAHGAPILIGEEERIAPQDGRTLLLWTEKPVQQMVERRLAEGIRKYGAKEGSVVILDPKSGGVLASASIPSYDPRIYQNFDKSVYKSPVVAATYEPGSTFKVLIMAAAINEKLVKPDTIMDESGPVAVGPNTIRTWNNQYHGPISMTQVLEYSSNVGMVDVARRLGKSTMLAYIRKFGFGKSTNIDLEEEASPQLRPDSQWQEIDELTASFGQGIAVTPIQMVAAVAALANGGKLMEPHVVKEIREAKGKVIPVKPRVVSQIVSPSTASIVAEMMVAAVDNGEAKWAKPKGYRIAGKTGTAQIPVAGHYDATKTIASFVGFAPADNPSFVMLVTLTEPTSSPWGSETAAPLFFTIARDLFTYWGIPPQ